MKPLMLLLIAVLPASAENAVLDSWLARQGGIHSLDSRFTQERKLPSLKMPITTRGRVCFEKPDKVRWQLGEPFETLAVSDGNHLFLLDSATKIARRTSVDSPHAARFALMSGKGFQSNEAFYRAFEVIEARVTDGIHQFTVRAKDRKLRVDIPWIFLDIDPAKNELRVLELELQDKSRLRTLFENPKFNTKLDDALFKPDLTGYEMK